MFVQFHFHFHFCCYWNPNIFIADTFKSLKQRVLWKYEEDSTQLNCPPNVLVKKWMPQNDVLAHPNVVLFISHGGLLGTIESIHHGVPILAIPFFGDQFRNAHRIMASGNGQLLHYNQITIESFSKAITEITTKATYQQQAKYMSDTFNDNAVHPMDEAMFWIEHVAKFNGAKHLKSHAIHMSWFTYLLLDIVMINALVGLMAATAFSISIRKLFWSKKSNDHENLAVKKKIWMLWEVWSKSPMNFNQIIPTSPKTNSLKVRLRKLYELCHNVDCNSA